MIFRGGKEVMWLHGFIRYLDIHKSLWSTGTAKSIICFQVSTQSHIPFVSSGYTGHIPARVTPSSLTIRDPNAKSLIMENYTPYQGYTGRLGR